MNRKISQYLCIFFFLIITRISAVPIPGLVNPGYLTVGLVNLESNYVTFTTKNGVTTASGFDVDMYCYIAQQLGLKIKFLGYQQTSAPTPIEQNPLYGNAANALNAGGIIDCFGGSDYSLLNFVNNAPSNALLQLVLDYTGYYYGVVTTVYPTIPSYFGIAFLKFENATLKNLRCELLQLVEQAVDKAVRTGFWTCALRRNNAIKDNPPETTYIDLTGNCRSPEALLSSTLGLIPVASSQAEQAGTEFGCTRCILPELPKRSCLVEYLALQAPKNCNKTVALQYTPAP